MSRRKRLPPEPIVLTIDSLAHDGRGVARVDGKAVFVHGALPGEQVRARITRRRRDLDEGVTQEVLSASPERVTPDCAFYDRCGGCSLQHLAPWRQLEAKQTMVLENLRRIGAVTPEQVLEPVSGPQWGYRHKARLAVRNVRGKGRVLVGFRERQSPYVADMTRCEVLHPSVGKLLEPLSELIGELGIRNRVPQIEVAVGDELVVLVFRVLDPPSPEDEQRLRHFAVTHDIEIHLQPGNPESVYPLTETPGELNYTLPAQGLKLAFSPLDFTQVNHAMNRQLVTQALERLAPAADEQILDLFCGLGNFSLPLARCAAGVTGVEGDEALVTRAQANARANNIDNARFVCADLHDGAALSRVSWLQERFDAVLIDPPRSGAREVLPALAAMGYPRVLYVSCHPATLARDAGLLVHEQGYALRELGVLDMFPHTSHVESMALFERNAGK